MKEIKYLSVSAAAAMLRGVLSILLSVVPRRAQDQFHWPAVSGPYSVGILDSFARDARGEFSPIRMYYPCRRPLNGSPATVYRGEQLHSACMALATILPKKVIRIWATKPTSAWQDAPIATPVGGKISQFPVVIFSHGLGGVNTQNTWLLEALASQGIVVCSLTHYPGAAFSFTPTGEVKSADRQLRMEMMTSDAIRLLRKVRREDEFHNRHSLVKQYAKTEPFVSLNRVWADNITALINELTRRNPDWLPRSIYQRIDSRRIALIGMSFGGSASATAGFGDDRVKAVVNLDGAQYGAELINASYPHPLLLIHSSDALLGERGTINDFHYDVLDGTSDASKVTRILMRHASHLSFTDMAFYKNSLLRRLLRTHREDHFHIASTLLSVIRKHLAKPLMIDEVLIDDSECGSVDVETINRSYTRELASTR